MEKLKDWIFTQNDDGSFDLANKASSVRLCSIKPSIELSDGSITPDSNWVVTIDERLPQISFQLADKWQIVLTFAETGKWLSISTVVKNLSGEPVVIKNIKPFVCDLKSQSNFDRVLFNGKDMCEYSALEQLSDNHKSNAVIGLTDSKGDNAVVLGFTNLGDAFYSFELDKNLSIESVCNREGIQLAAGDSLEISNLAVGVSDSLSGLMDEYACSVAENLGSREADIATGWCSWYYYYDTLTEDDIWENLKAIKDQGLSDKLKFIQIDDGWNLPTKDTPRLWGDWMPGGLFPAGMKDLADRIKAEGFTPGLWLAPFSVDSNSDLYKQHSDWLVQGDDGPVDCFGAYALDLSRPEVLGFIRETFERVFNDWGFDYIKIDFLLHAVLPGKRSDNTKTTTQLLRNALQVIRDVAGERFILCCGCPMGPAIGICDGMRIGNDVSSRWDVRVNTEAWPAGNLNIRAAAIHTIWRQWMHGRWWQNDPDCIVTRDYGSEPEKKIFTQHFSQFAEKPPYGLSNEEALFWVRLVWFTGAMTLVSENMPELSKDRLAMLDNLFPLNDDVPRWVDWYENPQIAILANKEMIGVFNLSDDAFELSISAEKFDLKNEWEFKERISGESFSGNGDMMQFPSLLPHAGRIWTRQ